MCKANRAVLLLGACLTVPTVALADPVSDLSDMVRELRYEDALARVEGLRASRTTSAEVRLRAIELAAVAHLGLGQLDEARRAFADLLTLDPGAELTLRRPSPRIVELFQSVRAARGEEEPRAGLRTSLAAESDTSVTASATPEGEHAIARVVFRADRGGRTSDVEASDEGPPWTAPIPVTDAEDRARLSVVARGLAPSGALAAVSPPVRLDPDGQVVQAGAGEVDPVGSDVQPEEEPRRGGGIATRWWFWGAIGAVVVGGSITAIVLATSGSDPARPGDLGAYRLTPAE